MADTYPFDPSMTQVTNRILREQHVITSTNFRNYHYVIPHFAPFFAESLSMRMRLPNNQLRDLVEGRDYYLSHQFLDASATTNRMLCGSISFLDTDTEGVLEINYHTLGGMWTLTPAQIIEIMANNMRNPRITSWEFVANPPTRFPVVDHPHDIHDFKTMRDVQHAIDGVRDAVLANSGGGLAQHVANLNNPHNVTKTQVGLGNVADYPVASLQEAQQGIANNRYMTALRVANAIDYRAGQMLDNHANNKNNPHSVTKQQVGLGSVEDYPVATITEAQQGTSNTRYMTPARVAAAIQHQAGNLLSDHVGRQDNPHNVTKDQIGLFNVQNYMIATAQEARDGERNDRYMTPLRTNQLVQQYVFGSLGSHTSDFDNPHNVTKSQIGLGNVQNYSIALPAEMLNASIADRYVTPQGVHLVTSPLQIAINSHIADLDNPHQVSAAQLNVYTKDEINAMNGDWLSVHDVASDSYRLNGKTESEIYTGAFESPQGEGFSEDILNEVLLMTVSQASAPNSATGTWYQVHRLTTGNTGGGDEALDGYTVVSIGGRRGVPEGASAFVRMQTMYRPTTGVAMRVENIGATAIDPAIRFGYARTANAVTACIFVPANAGMLRVSEFGNAESADLLALGPNPPTGYVDAEVVSTWTGDESLVSRLAAAEQAIVAIQNTLNGITVI